MRDVFARKERSGVEKLEVGVAVGAERHRGDNTNSKFQFDVGLDHVGIERRHDDVGDDFGLVESLVDAAAAGKARLVSHDRPFRDGLERQLLFLRQWMGVRHDDAVMPRVPRKGDEFRARLAVLPWQCRYRRGRPEAWLRSPVGLASCSTRLTLANSFLNAATTSRQARSGPACASWPP